MCAFWGPPEAADPCLALPPPWQLFDMSTPELQAHHRQLEPLAALRPSAALAEHLALVRQELEERGASERILYALVEPPAPAPAPPPAAAPGRVAGDPDPNDRSWSSHSSSQHGKSFGGGAATAPPGLSPGTGGVHLPFINGPRPSHSSDAAFYSLAKAPTASAPVKAKRPKPRQPKPKKKDPPSASTQRPVRAVRPTATAPAAVARTRAGPPPRRAKSVSPVSSTMEPAPGDGSGEESPLEITASVEGIGSNEDATSTTSSQEAEGDAEEGPEEEEGDTAATLEDFASGILSTAVPSDADPPPSSGGPPPGTPRPPGPGPSEAEAGPDPAAATAVPPGRPPFPGAGGPPLPPRSETPPTRSASAPPPGGGPAAAVPLPAWAAGPPSPPAPAGPSSLHRKLSDVLRRAQSLGPAPTSPPGPPQPPSPPEPLDGGERAGPPPGLPRPLATPGNTPGPTLSDASSQALNGYGSRGGMSSNASIPMGRLPLPRSPVTSPSHAGVRPDAGAPPEVSRPRPLPPAPPPPAPAASPHPSPSLSSPPQPASTAHRPTSSSSSATSPRGSAVVSVDPVVSVATPQVDYLKHFPTFLSLFVPAKLGAKLPAELDVLLEQQRVLGQWAHCMAGLDEETEEEDDVDEDRDDGGPAAPRPAVRPEERPALPLAAWDADVMAESSALCFKVQRSREEVYELLMRALTPSEGWREIPAPGWNVLWTWRRPRVHQRALLAWQVANHYPNSAALTRKDLLKKQLTKYARLPGKTGGIFNISPKTFILPSEYVGFAEEYAAEKQAGRPNLWIMKPVGMSRGRGIELLADIQAVTYGVSVVIQRYVDQPLLLQDYKFDLRLYVVVTSFSPLEAFLYTNGFARFASVKYSADRQHLADRFMHLTNTAVQQDCPSAGLFQGGTKCDLPTLGRLLGQAGVDWAAVWGRVADTVLKSLCCAEDAIDNAPGAFELFGYDVLLDRELRPWLIEVNASPSMEVDTPLDEEVKTQLIQDIIRLIDPLPYDRHALALVVERRIRELQRPAKGRAAPGRQDQAQQLGRDLEGILRGRLPRRYGEDPRHGERFERLAPSVSYAKYTKLKRM